MFGTAERPEFSAKDACRVLDIHNSRRALAEMIPATEKGVRIADTPGGPQEVATVTEGGLYRLVARSRKPGAEKFQSWLFNEVVPSIRKHGCYPPPAGSPVLPNLDLRDVRTLAPLALQLVQVVQEQQMQLAEQAPKVEAFHRLQDADGAVSLTTAGRILGRQPHILIGTMERERVLVRGDHGKLMPAFDYRERGYFIVRERVICGHAYPQTLVTPAGLQWLAERYPATDQPGTTALTYRITNRSLDN
jgi:prophage antirepressor-like protein